NVPALRARTRNAAWKASSASWASRSTCRQTPNTIGPWRFTRAAKASSSPCRAKRPSSSASVASGSGGRPVILRRYWITVLNCAADMAVHLLGLGFLPLYWSPAGNLIHEFRAFPSSRQVQPPATSQRVDSQQRIQQLVNDTV